MDFYKAKEILEELDACGELQGTLHVDEENQIIKIEGGESSDDEYDEDNNLLQEAWDMYKADMAIIKSKGLSMTMKNVCPEPETLAYTIFIKTETERLI